MSKFEFHTPEIDQALSGMIQARARMSSLLLELSGESFSLYTQKSAAVRSAAEQLNSIRRKVYAQYAGTIQMETALKQIKQEIRAAEVRACLNQILIADFRTLANMLFDVGWVKRVGKVISPLLSLVSNSGMPWWTPVAGGGIGLTGLGLLSGLGGKASFQADGEFFHTETKGSASANFTLVKDGKDYQAIGAEASGKASFSVAHGRVSSSLGLISDTIEGDVGKATVSGKASAVLFKDGKLSPQLGAEAKVTAEGATIKHSGKFGTDQFNIHSEQEGTLGYAEAKAGAKVGTEGVSVEAKAGAYAARGKASTGFTLFGIKVDLEGSANFGGASIGGEYKVTSNEIIIGGEAGLLAGLGIKIKISK